MVLWDIRRILNLWIKLKWSGKFELTLEIRVGSIGIPFLIVVELLHFTFFVGLNLPKDDESTASGQEDRFISVCFDVLPASIVDELLLILDHSRWILEYGKIWFLFLLLGFVFLFALLLVVFLLRLVLHLNIVFFFYWSGSAFRDVGAHSLTFSAVFSSFGLVLSRQDSLSDFLLLFVSIVLNELWVLEHALLGVHHVLEVLRHLQRLVEANEGSWSQAKGEEVLHRVPVPVLHEEHHADYGILS